MYRTIALPILFAGLVLAGASSFSIPVYAQSTGTSGTGLPNPGSSLGVTAPSGDPILQGAGVASNGTPITGSGSSTDASSGSFLGGVGLAAGCALNPTLCAPAASTIGAGVTNLAAGAVSTIGSDILKAVASFILELANWLLGAAGVLFNLVMVYGVFQFANTIGNSPGVLTAWGILRDLANMALLFGFIFMGIATILDTGAVQSFTAKRALPSLLIFAILMNFSLFTCEAMIDVSNALSSTLYTQANTQPCLEAAGTNGAGLTDTNCGISYGLAGHIMQSTGLAGIWAIQSGTPVSATALTLVGLALFATIGAIVFFAASIMLAIRVIILTLLMVVSPIGFAGMAIPPLRKLAGDWWTRVIHQAFYAPIMLLLILISLKIADTFTSAGANNSLGSSTLAAAVTGQDATSMGVFLVFALVIGFMIASLIVANRFGAAGAAMGVNFGKKIVLGSYGGVAGFAGRNTIGRGSNWAQKKYMGNTALRRFAVNTRLDSSIRKITDAGKNAKFGSANSFSDKDNTKKARAHELHHLDTIDSAKGAGTTDEMSKALKNISEFDLPNLVNSLKGNEAKLQLISESLSADKFDKLMNNKEFTDEKTKEKMKDLRYKNLADATQAAATAAAAYSANPSDAALKKAYEDAQKALGDEVRQLGGKDATYLSQSQAYSNLLNDSTFAGALSDDQFKAFRGNDNLTTVQKRTLEDQRNSYLNDPTMVSLKLPTMKMEDINKLKDTTLTDPKVIDALSIRVKNMKPKEVSQLNGDAVSDEKVFTALEGRAMAHVDLTSMRNPQGLVKYVERLTTTPDSQLTPEQKKWVNEFRMQVTAVPALEQRWKAAGIYGL